jgi:hypothetical protein
MTAEERRVEASCEAYRAGREAGEAGEAKHVPDEHLAAKCYRAGYRVGERLTKDRVVAELMRLTVPATF